jgi:hypothetical protein
VAKLNHIRGLVIANMSAKHHIFAKVACVENARRKSDLLDVRVDVVFAFLTVNQINAGEVLLHRRMARGGSN